VALTIVTMLGLAGAGVSAYVWYKQTTAGPVLCVGDGCAKVIRSPYGRLFGIPNGALGVGYFGAAAVVSLVARPGSLLWDGLIAASGVAMLLYAYLTYLQAAVLRAWCMWCLGSAALTAALLWAAVRIR
jgi:uncharacterized membrane protein